MMVSLLLVISQWMTQPEKDAITERSILPGYASFANHDPYPVIYSQFILTEYINITKAHATCLYLL